MRSHSRDVSRSTRPVTKLPCRPKVVSSIPKRRGGRCGNPAIFARASAAIARHAVDQLTLKARATAAVERSHAARAIAAHNRAVTPHRGPTSPVDSVKVLTQPGVSQPNRRLVTTRVVGRS